MKKWLIIIASILIIGGLAVWAAYKFIDPPKKDTSNKSNLIVVVSPIRDSEVSSPISVSGRARGSWFFEGSFPISLQDEDGNVLAESHTTAQGEWMTANFVNFVGTLQFAKQPKGTKGFLILEKDNPSGLPENADHIEVPVFFK